MGSVTQTLHQLLWNQEVRTWSSGQRTQVPGQLLLDPRHEDLSPLKPVQNSRGGLPWLFTGLGDKRGPVT